VGAQEIVRTIGQATASTNALVSALANNATSEDLSVEADVLPVAARLRDAVRREALIEVVQAAATGADRLLSREEGFSFVIAAARCT